MEAAVSEPQNPYFGMPGTFKPEQFYGSPKLVRLILEQITFTPPHALELIGLVGMAKTTLLHYLANPHGAIEKYWDCLQAPYEQEPERLFMALIQFRTAAPATHSFVYLYQQFCAAYFDYSNRPAAARPALADPLPTLPRLDEAASPVVAVDTMQSAIRQLVAHGIRPVLLLDDFDLAFARLNEEETTRLRPWREDVAFVLVAEQPLDEVNPTAAGSPFIQTLQMLAITGLSPAEARQMLEEPAAKAGCPFPAADLDVVLPYAGRHPYLLILTGRALWEMRARLQLLERPDTPLSEVHYQMLRGRLQNNFRRTFQRYGDLLTPLQLQALRALIAGGEVNYAVLETLVTKGLVQYNAGGGYEPFSPLFAEFLQSRPAEPPLRSDLALTGTEDQLYDYLRHNADRVCPFDELARQVWRAADPNDADLRRRMQVTVSRLRKKLKATTGEDISSVRDQGYRLLPRATT